MFVSSTNPCVQSQGPNAMAFRGEPWEVIGSFTFAYYVLGSIKQKAGV